MHSHACIHAHTREYAHTTRVDVAMYVSAHVRVRTHTQGPETPCTRERAWPRSRVCAQHLCQQSWRGAGRGGRAGPGLGRGSSGRRRRRRRREVRLRQRGASKHLQTAPGTQWQIQVGTAASVSAAIASDSGACQEANEPAQGPPAPQRGRARPSPLLPPVLVFALLDLSSASFQCSWRG